MSSTNESIRPVSLEELFDLNISKNDTVVIITGMEQTADSFPDGLSFDRLRTYLVNAGAEYSTFNFGIDHGEQVNSIFFRAFETIMDAFAEGCRVLITGPEEATNNALAFTARAEANGQTFWDAYSQTQLTIPALHRIYTKNILWNVGRQTVETTA